MPTVIHWSRQQRSIHARKGRTNLMLHLAIEPFRWGFYLDVQTHAWMVKF